MEIEIRQFDKTDEDTIVQLWTDCGLVVPWNDPHQDIQRKLGVQAEFFLVGCYNDQIIASVMAGYDGHRGWINYLAVHPLFQRKGIASQIMEKAESLLKKKGCPKINLQVRSANAEVLAFYKSLRFKTDEVVSLGKRIDND